MVYDMEHLVQSIEFLLVDIKSSSSSPLSDGCSLPIGDGSLSFSL